MKKARWDMSWNGNWLSKVRQVQATKMIPKWKISEQYSKILNTVNAKALFIT